MLPQDVLDLVYAEVGSDPDLGEWNRAVSTALAELGYVQTKEP